MSVLIICKNYLEDSEAKFEFLIDTELTIEENCDNLPMLNYRYYDNKKYRVLEIPTEEEMNINDNLQLDFGADETRVDLEIKRVAENEILIKLISDDITINQPKYQLSIKLVDEEK